MNKYKAQIWRQVSFGGKFSHNSQRDLMLYAETVTEAKIQAGLDCNAGDKNEVALIETSDEFVYRVDYLGNVQFNCSVTFRTDDGALIRPTNTVLRPYQVVSWLKEVFKDEAMGYSVISMEVTEVLHIEQPGV